MISVGTCLGNRHTSTPKLTTACRFAFPIPIPQSHEFFLTELDYKDGVVHLSTAQQVPGVLKRFFADVPAVALIKFDYGRLSAWRRIDWVKADGEGGCILRSLGVRGV